MSRGEFLVLKYTRSPSAVLPFFWGTKIDRTENKLVPTYSKLSNLEDLDSSLGDCSPQARESLGRDVKMWKDRWIEGFPGGLPGESVGRLFVLAMVVFHLLKNMCVCFFPCWFQKEFITAGNMFIFPLVLTKWKLLLGNILHFCLLWFSG